MNRWCLIDGPPFLASGYLGRNKYHATSGNAHSCLGIKGSRYHVILMLRFCVQLQFNYGAHENTCRDEFCRKTPLIVHFDGKLLPDDEGANTDRMTVVSGIGIEKLLAIPKLPGSGIDVVMGNKVVKILREWEDVSEWMAGLCFYTTNANTGGHSGAITFIQEAFDKGGLWLVDTICFK